MEKRTSLISTIFLSIIAVLFGCNSSVNQFSPEQVVDNALAEAADVKSFYGVSEMTIKNKDELIEKMTIKEWRDGNRVRIEVEGTGEEAISVYDGTQFVAYDKTNNQALIDEDESIEFTQMSVKEQAETLLELISESHDVEMVGEEKIAGRDTFHLQAEQKNDAALFGDQELWIDKENWLVLKMISVSGNMVSTAEYQEVNFNTDITDDLFTIELPDDVEMIDTSGFEPTEVTSLEESVEKIGQSFLYVPETEELMIDLIDYTEMEGASTHKEINVTYMKDDMPYFDLAIIDSTVGEDDDLDLFDTGEEKVDVRGQDGSYFEMDEFRILSWSEDGLNYSVQLVDPGLNLDDMEKLLQTMEKTK